MKKALLKVDDLSVKFKTMEGMQTAVQGVSLEVMEGEVFCIVGESGCGKSLTSLSIMGLVENPASSVPAPFYWTGRTSAA